MSILSKAVGINPWVLGAVAIAWVASTGYVGIKAWTIRGAVEAAANLKAENARINAKLKASEEIQADMEKEALINSASDEVIKEKLNETKIKLAHALKAGSLVACPWTDADELWLRSQGNGPQ